VAIKQTPWLWTTTTTLLSAAAPPLQVLPHPVGVLPKQRDDRVATRAKLLQWLLLLMLTQNQLRMHLS
jgi:hypothetical protein